ncbi:MAG: type VI secretion system ATPase TssH [Gammaproteobacteria bacterium]|jgi:type VI secretion system protein VasG
MAQLNIKSLVDKLNDTCRRALEDAVGLTMSRTHYNVEIEHWLLKLLEIPDSDVSSILKHYGVNLSRLNRDLTATLDSLKTGNSRPPALSPHVVDLAREAWLIASLQYGASHTGSGHLVAALVTDETLARMARGTSAEFGRLSADALQQDLPSLIADSPEQEGEPAGTATDTGGVPKTGGKTPALDQFTVDLTEQARQGRIDPVLGRDSEVRQIVDILTRRRQNNPILTGEAGVGKTAVVEGFALRLAAGDVPPALQDVSIRSLDLALLQAGAGVKGEFENRLKSVINEVKGSPKPIILFIDEAHTLIGAGGQAGQGDAANLLKPALARGELRTIAATTWAEYKKYFERDAALARRFQTVKVEEPAEAQAVEMMRGLVGTLEAHHRVRVLDEAVREAVRLSHRYITGRQLPDKSVSLLDTACARVAIGQNSIPPAIEDCRRRLEQIKVATRILEQEASAGAEHDDEIAGLGTEQATLEAELEALEARWQQELDLVRRIQHVRARLEGRPELAPAADQSTAGDGTVDSPAPTDDERAAMREELATLNAELLDIQGEAPLLHVVVDGQTVAHVVSEWTGIPVGRMVSDEINAILNLKDRMEENVVGQSHAMEAIAESIRTSRASLGDPGRPIGVFMLAGTSGVGKTETAITLANLLYGGEQNMTVINMSEFKEEHKVSLLMGSPPGYVGYGEGGVLTEAVRRKPYSVVLLDEMEKAHPGVQDIFYQVFDKGHMKDGEGRDIDFKNTVILMTTNAGTDAIMSLCADPETMPDAEGLAEALHPELLKTFKPAFLGRVTVVPYFPLADDVMKQIIRLKLGKVARRVRENYNAPFDYSDALVDSIAQRCTEVESGARNVDHILTRTLLPELSAQFLTRVANGQAIASVRVDVDSNGFVYDLQ